MAVGAQERVEEVGRLQRMRVEGSLEGVAEGVVEEVQGPQGAVDHLRVGGRRRGALWSRGVRRRWMGRGRRKRGGGWRCRIVLLPRVGKMCFECLAALTAQLSRSPWNGVA